MKITAGMGSIDDYPEYVKAGADEVFIGYVPERWQTRYGLSTPLNRREVCYYNVQIGSRSELEILASQVKIYHVPVTIAFNGLIFSPEQYPLIGEIIRGCLSLGFDSVIIADFALLLYLNQIGLAEKLNIHLSGEFGEINDYMLDELVRLGVTRLIFHRKVSLKSMEQIIQHADSSLEFEAFILNENCHFHGGYCNSLHCDELVPMCRMPYRLSSIDGSDGEPISKLVNEPLSELASDSFYDYGIESLPQMAQIGITHLKVVGRGAATKDMIDSIHFLSESLDLQLGSFSQIKMTAISPAKTGDHFLIKS